MVLPECKSVVCRSSAEIQCKKHQPATKKLDIYKAPDILVICIKRFGSSRRLSDKVSHLIATNFSAQIQLDNLVNFPIEGLDLTERIGERKVAHHLHLSSEDAKQFDMEGDEEASVYDLCGSTAIASFES